MSIAKFANTRAKIRRIMDNSEAHGWVRLSKAGTLDIEFNPMAELSPGEDVEVFLDCSTSSTSFLTTVLGVYDLQVISFRIPELIRIEAPTSHSRIKGKVQMGSVNLDGQDTVIEVADISPSGIGILSATDIENDAMVPLKFHVTNGVVEFTGRVIYSKFDQEIEKFRIGLSIEHFSRVDAARWNAFLAA